MKILVLDQARNGAYAIFDYENKRLLKYGTWGYKRTEYTYSQAIRMIENLVENLIYDNDISAVFIEDISMRRNVAVFKNLAQLQGVLINLFEKSNILYDIIVPSVWQGYCKARGRKSKEIKDSITAIEVDGKSKSKILSLQYVDKKYHVHTEDDNLADAISIGDYVINKIKIQPESVGMKGKN